jgi:hypothetical protein
MLALVNTPNDKAPVEHAASAGASTEPARGAGRGAGVFAQSRRVAVVVGVPRPGLVRPSGLRESSA